MMTIIPAEVEVAAAEAPGEGQVVRQVVPVYQADAAAAIGRLIYRNTLGIKYNEMLVRKNKIFIDNCFGSA